jgi:hypothetical protein
VPSAASTEAERPDLRMRHAHPMTREDPAGYPIGPDGLPELPLRVLEDDETVPPRPEEDLADLERTDPPPRP